jgi:type II secretory pathway component PulC
MNTEDVKKNEEMNQEQVQAQQKPKKSPVQLKAYLLFFVVACVGVVLANSLFRLFITPVRNNISLAAKAKEKFLSENKKTAVTGQETIKGVSPSTPPPVSLLQELSSQKQTQPTFVLNGVFFSENGGCALINNQIVKEGDHIEGATVVRIALEGVELKLEDSVIKLTSR